MSDYNTTIYPIYNPDIDVDMVVPQSQAVLRRCLFGGSWWNFVTVFCGSRGTLVYYYTASNGLDFTTRGCKENEYYPGARYDSDNYQMLIDYITIPMDKSDVDPISYGKFTGIVRRGGTGYAWYYGVSCGSRSGLAQYYSMCITNLVSARGCNGT